MNTPIWFNASTGIFATTAAIGLANLGCGWYLSNPYLAGGGAAGTAYVVLRTLSRTRRTVRRQKPTLAQPARGRPSRQQADPNDLGAVVRQMLEQGRYALLLRPQIAHNLNEDDFDRTLDLLHGAMSLVPDGEVVLGQIDDALDDGKLDDEEIATHRSRLVRVGQFFLDRYPVTNEQFHEFVIAGGYEQAALWEPSVLPAVLDFVDQSGQPGPRYWSEGVYPSDKADHPVVGVSWYEAQAYARWVGKRLPTDAEWVKAGSWPVRVSPTSRLQRRYPWGDTMDREKANLWAGGRTATVSVAEYTQGGSVGGIYQLIGNVWEWTRGNFALRGADGEELLLEPSLKCIRGGAFDTYFENQATCQFASGESALARKANIGFRCAVGVGDLVLAHPGAHPPAECEAEAPALEEVGV
ncbi:MAG: formylglycine-generating enzyme family protein [Rhodopirellula sp.]|nr:formylglycine-generating enzyme family protein [Rhodopirellula sp.]